MGRAAWCATLHGITKSWTRLATDTFSLSVAAMGGKIFLLNAMRALSWAIILFATCINTRCLCAVCSMGWRVVSQDGPTKIKRHFPFHLSTPLQMKNVNSASGMRWSPWKLQSELISLEEGKALPWEDQPARVCPQLWLMEARWGDPVCVQKQIPTLLPKVWSSNMSHLSSPDLSITDQHIPIPQFVINWLKKCHISQKQNWPLSGFPGCWWARRAAKNNFSLRIRRVPYQSRCKQPARTGADFGADCTSFLMQNW